MMAVDIETVGQILHDVAAEVIMPRFQNLAAHDIQEKTGPQDLVTIADIESERALSQRLCALVPGSAVVGEEAAAADPSVFDRLGEAGKIWLIDPVDGTWNFSRGQEPFGVIVALVEDGKTVAGWILAPVSGELAAAELGSGAWRYHGTAAPSRLNVAKPGRLETMTGALYVGARRAPVLYAQAKRIRNRLGGLSYSRCVAFEYLALAGGRHHFALFTRLMPWDHAAGTLIHAEAGGHNARLDGGPYLPTETEGFMLYAPDEPCWRILRDLLTEDSRA